MIARIWRGFKVRSEYRLLLRHIVRIQRMIRMRNRRRVLMNFRKALIRPLQLSIIQCLDLSVSGVAPTVICSVVDPKRPDVHYWANCTRCGDDIISPTFNETILIPGIHGNQTVLYLIFFVFNMTRLCLRLSCRTIRQSGRCLAKRLSISVSGTYGSEEGNSYYL